LTNRFDYLEEFGSNKHTIKIPSASTETNHLRAFKFSQLDPVALAESSFFQLYVHPSKTFCGKTSEGVLPIHRKR
jgi:hypothetical protein